MIGRGGLRSFESIFSTPLTSRNIRSIAYPRVPPTPVGGHTIFGQIDLEATLPIVTRLNPHSLHLPSVETSRREGAVLPGVVPAAGFIQHSMVGFIRFLNFPFAAQINRCLPDTMIVE